MTKHAKLKMTLLSCLTVFLLSGCSSGGLETRDFCKLAKPIYVGKPDYFSDQTARQILSHNELGKALCKWSNGANRA